MSATRAALKEYFNTGDKPTEAQFAALIDAFLNLADDLPELTIEKTKLNVLTASTALGAGGTFYADTTAAAVVFTLPDATADNHGTVYKIYKLAGGNNVTMSTPGAQMIGDSTSQRVSKLLRGYVLVANWNETSETGNYLVLSHNVLLADAALDAIADPADVGAEVADDQTGGTAGDRLNNVGATFNQATINNNFASQAAMYNALRTDVTNLHAQLVLLLGAIREHELINGSE